MLLSVVLTYMKMLVVLCLTTLGSVSETCALQTMGELLW